MRVAFDAVVKKFGAELRGKNSISYAIKRGGLKRILYRFFRKIELDSNQRKKAGKTKN